MAGGGAGGEAGADEGLNEAAPGGVAVGRHERRHRQPSCGKRGSRGQSAQSHERWREAKNRNRRGADLTG